jgi:hypothetical protein
MQYSNPAQSLFYAMEILISFKRIFLLIGSKISYLLSQHFKIWTTANPLSFVVSEAIKICF